jgi:hypothetical protein
LESQISLSCFGAIKAKGQSFDSERAWWRFFQTRVVYANFDIYVFIHSS